MEIDIVLILSSALAASGIYVAAYAAKPKDTSTPHTRLEDFKAHAKTLKLTLVTPRSTETHSLRGTRKGISFHLQAPKHSRHDAFNSVHAMFPVHAPIEFTIRTAYHNAYSLPDPRNIQSGDPDFDNTFTLRSKHPEAALALLTPTLRQMLQNYSVLPGDLLLSENMLLYREDAPFEDHTRAHDIITLHCATINALRNALQHFAETHNT